MAPLSPQEEAIASTAWLLASDQSDHDQEGDLPIEPLVELTVCPQGPPVCQFTKIQEAIDAAPFTAPVESWDPPPQIPFVRIAPGLYEESITILKNIWLQGADKEKVILRGRIQGTNPPFALFIAGSFGLGIGVENMTIEGGLRITGEVTGLIRNNRFQPDALGKGGADLGGTLNIALVNNLFARTGIYVVGALPLFRDRLGGFRGQEASVVIDHNVFTGSPDAALYVRESEEVLVALNRIQGASIGVVLLDVERAVIWGNILEDNGEGISGCCGNRGVTITGNRIERNRGSGLSLSLGSGGEYLVEGNRVLENGGAGIEWGSMAQLRILGNTVTGNRVGLRLGSRKVADLEKLKECRDNQVFGNEVNYAGWNHQPLEELRRRCEGP